MQEAPVDPASALCLSCGLCCDGGLFAAVKLMGEDRARFTANGLPSVERLPHPCPHFTSPTCSIYAVRPSRCGDYRCKVLKARIAGTIDSDVAHGLVDRAKAMRAQVGEVLPQGTTIVDLAREVRTDAVGARTAPQLQVLARFAAYRMFVERYFLEAKSQWMDVQDD